MRKFVLVGGFLIFAIPGWAFQDCPHCPEMLVVPAGKYMMGTPESEERRKKREGPRHEVTIAKPFAIGKYEVTVDEFKAFVKAGGRNMSGGCRYATSDGWKMDADLSWEYSVHRQTGRHPVQCVSWNDAQAYIAWLSKETGKTYRLPTEAEWEYAVRAGTTGPFYFGDAISPDQVNYNAHRRAGPYNKGSLYRGEASRVGQFPANEFGLHDMHGNVAEWVQDCATKKTWKGYGYYTWQDAKAYEPRADCRRHVVRGGSWYFSASGTRSGYRGRVRTVRRYVTVGFRVVQTLP